jgi:adenylate cyclase
VPDRPSIPTEQADDQDRIEALARLRTLLHGLGCTDEEIDHAVEDDVIDLLVVDRMLVPTGHLMTQAEVAEQTGIPLDVTKRFWRALGFLDVEESEQAFTEMDVEAIRLFESMVAMGLVELEPAVQMARVIGSSMARIAEAEAAPGNTPIIVGTGDSILDADEFARNAGSSIPAMGRLLEYVWRRHLQAATRRAMLHRIRETDEGVRPIMAVGFADMVGFTMLSQHLGDNELAAVVARFEELAHDTVVALGGRVVKMIGDEVMFVVPTADSAAQIGLSLAEAYSDDDLLSDVRVALAVGPVLVKDGDYYGPVVNLASRLVNVAHPGTVLVSDEFRNELAAEGVRGIDTRPLRTRNLKDLGRVQMWKLLRAGTEPGSDSRRTMRWERLGEVLRELDELRERGETLRPGGRIPRDPASRSDTGRDGRSESSGVEAGGGDAVGPKGEGSLERGDRATR